MRVAELTTRARAQTGVQTIVPTSVGGKPQSSYMRHLTGEAMTGQEGRGEGLVRTEMMWECRERRPKKLPDFRTMKTAAVSCSRSASPSVRQKLNMKDFGRTPHDEGDRSGDHQMRND